jgi:hypothetical protein
MKKGKINLDDMQIAQSCSTDWQGMTGDENKRFCHECNKNVYNISTMSRGEVEDLIRGTGGKFCARIIRDVNGSVITASASAGFQFGKLRASKWAGAVVTTILSLSNYTPAQAPVQENQSQAIQPGQSTKQDTTVTLETRTSIFSGTIYDINKAVILDANVVLTNLKTGEQIKTKSSEDGTFQFNSLDTSLYNLEVQAQGFKLFHRKLQPIRATENLRMDITMEVGVGMGDVVYIVQPGTYEKFHEKLMQPFRFVGNILKKFI